MTDSRDITQKNLTSQSHSQSPSQFSKSSEHIEDAAYGFVPYVLDPNGVPIFLVILHHKGHWGFPKGHAEGEETPLEAAHRELLEETGLQPTVIHEDSKFFEEYVFEKEDGALVHKVNTYWVALLPHQTVVPQAEEVLDFVWLPFTEAYERMTFDTGRKSLAIANELLQALL